MGRGREGGEEDVPKDGGGEEGGSLGGEDE